MGKTYFLCAGEASGDIHGANLMKSLLKLDPSIHFVGVGGPHMRALGLECLRESETLSVIGLVEVLKNIRFFKRALADLAQQVVDRKVDAFIPIDFPDFNLRMCERVKAKGVKVIYYICPQVWAWRKGRVHQIARVVDLLLTIFPFEADCFKGKDLRIEYVGHPLCDEIPLGKIPDNPSEGEGHLALMPGSRHSEINHHMPVLAPFLEAFFAKWPNVQVHIPCAQTLKPEDLRALMPEVLRHESRLILHEPGKSEEVLELCHAALIASGTSILQGVLSNRPLALFYRLNPLTYWIGTKVIDLPFVGLANLVAKREVCKELLQQEMSTANLLAESERLMWNGEARRKMLEDYQEIQQKLGGVGASDRAASLILEA